MIGCNFPDLKLYVPGIQLSEAKSRTAWDSFLRVIQNQHQCQRLFLVRTAGCHSFIAATKKRVIMAKDIRKKYANISPFFLTY
jgi:hypothetical protein